MKVYAKSNLIVESFNAKNKEGNKLRKKRGIKEGEAFEVKRQFTADTDAHGSECLEIVGPNEELYQVYAKDFVVEMREEKQVEKKSGVKQEETESGRLLRCIHEIIEDPKNEEFTFGFKGKGYSEEQDKECVRLGKIVGNTKIFIQGKVEMRSIVDVKTNEYKDHSVIYFHNSKGNLCKKWIYPSKNKSDEFLKGKIRSIMREWVSQSIEAGKKTQEANLEIEREQDQLMKELKEFSPVIHCPSDREVYINYGDPKRALVAGVKLDVYSNYVINLGRGGNSPAFNKEDLKVLLGILTKAV